MYEQARTLLDLILDRVDAPRAYVSVGQPAWDCEQLVVWPQTVQTGAPTTPRLDKSCLPWTVEYQISRIWCVPVGRTVGGKWTPPTVDALDAASEIVNDGGLELLDAVVSAVAGMHCANRLLAANARAAEGGYAGWDITVSVALQRGTP